MILRGKTSHINFTYQNCLDYSYLFVLLIHFILPSCSQNFMMALSMRNQKNFLYKCMVYRLFEFFLVIFVFVLYLLLNFHILCFDLSFWCSSYKYHCYYVEIQWICIYLFCIFLSYWTHNEPVVGIFFLTFRLLQFPIDNHIIWK